MPYITFEKKHSARTGNILFQYLFAKRISIEFGHKYIPIEEIDNRDDIFIIYESNVNDVIEKKIDISNKNIICDGFFQKSEYYIPYREQLLDIIYTTEEYWIDGKNKKYIKDFVNMPSSICLDNNSIVMHLRLDDFILYGCKTTDIIDPDYYLNILKKLDFGQLYIVCDKIRHKWEENYLKLFNKFNPIMIQGTLLEDVAIMRDCPNLIHSNSTLCWFISFISKTKQMRFIPDTNFYEHQKLKHIEKYDIYTEINPLTHQYLKSAF
jgi:hypothetical protein